MDRKAIYLNALENAPKAAAKLKEILNKSNSIIQQDIVILAFLRKTTRLIEAIRSLIQEGYSEEGQLLSRSLLECKIAFDFFLRCAKIDFDDVFSKIVDCMMLDKIKQLESLNYSICPPDRKQFWQEIKEKINERYSPEVLCKMKRYGFTCMTIKQSAEATDNKYLYDLVYRLYSRNIHSSDLSEHLMQHLSTDENIIDYGESRLNMLLEVIYICATSVLGQVNNWLGNPLNLNQYGLITLPVNSSMTSGNKNESSE